MAAHSANLFDTSRELWFRGPACTRSFPAERSSTSVPLALCRCCGMSLMKRLQLMAGVLLVGALHAQALSIFPEIRDTRVAATTNRELARGITTDGTNFLVVFQGDNLYPAADSTNQLAAQWVGAGGSLIGPRIDLAVNGGVPLVEFGTSNFLVSWVGNAAGAATIHGQFLDRLGNPSGASLVIASNTSAVEVGAMTFASGHFWIAWAQTNVSNHAGILLQRVSEFGVTAGDALAVGATNSGDQRFPALSASGTNVLVTWVARRAETNAWDVLGRFLDANGNASAEIAVSETPAVNPYPVAAASDGTNHLVVWSAEAGTNRIFFQGTYPNEIVLTTNQIPRVFGRLVTGNVVTTPEFSISSARWGQVSVSAAFDGTNYLVGWNDRRYAEFQNSYPSDGGKAWYLPAVTNQAVFFCFLDRAGQPVDWEFIGEALPPHSLYQMRPVPPQDFDNGGKINTGPVIRFGKNSAAVLRNRRSVAGNTNDVSVTSLTSPKPSSAEIKFVGIISNYPGSTAHAPPFVQVNILATNSHFIPQWSSNAVDWITPKPPFTYPYDEPADFIEVVGPGWNQFFLRFNPVAGFFRALEDKNICKSGLRKAARRKENWAYAGNWAGNDVPVDTDLWTSSADKHRCPSADWFINGSANSLPTCPVPFHDLP
jgi:hypothetical protein